MSWLSFFYHYIYFHVCYRLPLSLAPWNRVLYIVYMRYMNPLSSFIVQIIVYYHWYTWTECVWYRRPTHIFIFHRTTHIVYVEQQCAMRCRDQRRIPNFRYHIVFKFITSIYFRTWTLNVLQYINQKKTRRWLYNSSENVSAYHIHSYTKESGCGRGAQNSLY